MFDKILSKVGIGNAKVNTLLHQPAVMRGEFATGEIHITGGKVAQQINRIYIDLQTTYDSFRVGKKGPQNCQLMRVNISDAFTLDAAEEAIFDFEIEIPMVTPVSIHDPSLHLLTGLDVSFALDPKDRDPLQVLPDPATAQVLVAAEKLGLFHTQKSGHCIEFENSSGVPYVQEFIFHTPVESGLPIGELELLVISDGDIADIIMKMSLGQRGFSEWQTNPLQQDEDGVRLQVAHDHPFGPEELAQIIRENFG